MPMIIWYMKLKMEKQFFKNENLDILSSNQKANQLVTSLELNVLASLWYWFEGDKSASIRKYVAKDDIYWVSVKVNGRKKQKNPYYTNKKLEPNGERTKENAEFPSTKEITQEHYPSLTIQRANSNFEEFLNTTEVGIGSIDFKVVNYRKFIYTGDKKHCLNGDSWMEGSRGQRKHHEPYSYKKLYIPDDDAENNKTVSDIHQTFIHLAFDGKKLEVKEILLEQVKDNEGTLELIPPNKEEKKSQDNSSTDF
ncbi:hypothetical protein [Sulfurimonas sp.]|uniref:hypothetical protein n=3 Tax=Sulfurimonas sp. TaxID=2022749 RepID=UPI003D151617